MERHGAAHRIKTTRPAQDPNNLSGVKHKPLRPSTAQQQLRAGLGGAYRDEDDSYDTWADEERERRRNGDYASD